MAVLLQIVGAAPAGRDPGLALAQQDVATAEQELASSGLLTSQGLAPALQSVLQTVIQPEAAIIASISRRNQPARQVMVNRRATHAVVNWVDTDKRYHFDLYDSEQVGAASGVYGL